MSSLTRAEAIAYLMLKPEGSLNDWARTWGWSRSKVERFLHSLERAGAVVVERSKAGTRVSGCLGVSRPLNETTETLNPQSAAVSVSVSPHLDTGLLDRSRCVDTRYTEQLVGAMNDTLRQIYGNDYRPVKLDQKGSHRAGAAMQHAGVELEFARAELVRCCRAFNPSKHGKGQLPKSLALFSRGIITAWKRSNQLELGLPPRLTIARPYGITAPAPITVKHETTSFDPALQTEEGMRSALEELRARLGGV